MSKQRLLAILLSVFVGAAVLAGIFLAGSPAEERSRRADEQRVADLQTISFAIQSYYADTGALPASLEEAARQPNTYVPRITDAETEAPYGYEPGENGAYRLCATFTAPTPETTDRASVPPELSFWSHGAGDTCFDLEAREPQNSIKPLPVR